MHHDTPTASARALLHIMTLITLLAPAALTGCLRTQEQCVSASDCFGDELCQAGVCITAVTTPPAQEDMSSTPSPSTDMMRVTDPSPEMGCSTTSCPDLDPEEEGFDIHDLSPQMILSSEVAVSMRYKPYGAVGPCQYAITDDDAVWAGFVEQQGVDINQITLFRRDPTTSRWEDRTVAYPEGLFSMPDLEPAPDGQVTICVHEQLNSKVQLYQVGSQEILDQWQVAIGETEEAMCQVVARGEEQAFLFRESAGAGALSALKIARRRGANTPQVTPLDAAYHDTAWPIDLLIDQDAQWVALYYGSLGGRPSIRYGEHIEGAWEFETIETSFARVEREVAAALGPDGLLHVVTHERTVSQGEELFLLVYLHPEDEALDLVLPSYFIDSALTDLSIDPSGRPHLVFSDGDSRWYATLLDRRWHVYALPEPTSLLSSCLRVHADRDGRAHILMDTEGWQSTPADAELVDLIYRVIDVKAKE